MEPAGEICIEEARSAQGCGECWGGDLWGLRKGSVHGTIEVGLLLKPIQ